ncbi:adenylyl-sulfate kinase [Paenibacillus sp. NPDC058071]|uniref:adenylyl-sulfate kinase n=1 Tax=Paenibacillus sp. NPDC058071 TaxID=3346326 RepID=UPI0036DCB0BC
MASEDGVVWHLSSVSKEDRRQRNGHHSGVIWLTGLSGAGKSTLAAGVETSLHGLGVQVYVLDGDNLRHGLTRGLGFDSAGRSENIRRIGETAKLFVDAGLIVAVAAISPYREDRKLARDRFAPDEFIEVFVDCPLSECERRDPKGLYRKARSGDIAQFTGISAPYERPLRPEMTIDTSCSTARESVSSIIQLLIHKRWISEQDFAES